MIRIALAQVNTSVGDIDGNSARIEAFIREAASMGAHVVAVPELAITGYPPEDLVLKKAFVRANAQALRRVASTTDDVLAFVGFVDSDEKRLYNAAAICHRGEVLGVYRKQLLPNYGVFDERRYFEAGNEHILIETQMGVLGVCVCEDAWSDVGPVIAQGDAGAQVIVNINASPFHKNKLVERIDMLGRRASKANAAIAYVNAVGGQDELVFDGGSVVIGPDGALVASLPQFEERIEMIDVPLGESAGKRLAGVRRLRVELPNGPAPAKVYSESADSLDPAEEIYRALELGLSDYVRKNGFEKVVVGLSGGIDSTLTAAIAADALGASSVVGIAMPSQYSSSHSVEDAKQLAANLGIEMLEIPIAPIHHAYVETMQQTFGPVESGIAEENLQARIRGNLLMAISNRYGHLVIATGNKSEMACGYATLYGDMAGGFALLKDVFKTEVYDLARWRNTISSVVPDNVLTKPPSAELRPNQKDSDSLPPYDVLDPILEAYIEDDAGVADIIDSGHDRDVVERVIALVDKAEYKRRQAPPGPKVTTKAFGRDRRLPISNQWREGDVKDLPARSVGTEPPD